jgi:hypothetical protein
MEVTKFGDDDYNDYQLTMPTAQFYIWGLFVQKI